jgi:hypothetical protein
MSTLSPIYEAQLDALRANGYEVFGPAPASRTHQTPAVNIDDPAPGMKVLISRESRMVEGYGGTADEAVADALGKLPGVDADKPVRGGA